MQIPDAAIGPIFAAMIAGLVVFISTVLSKEQKTSEFRQAWIDELRKDVAQYVSGTVEFTALYCHKKRLGSNEIELLEENFDAIRDLQSIEYRIIFRLNPVKHGDLIAKIKGLRRQMLALYELGTPNSTLEASITDSLTADCKAILKNEWERVKKGEAGFKFVKWAAMAIAAIGLLVLLLYLIFRPPLNVSEQKTDTSVQGAQAPAISPTPSTITSGGQIVHVNVTTPSVPIAPASPPKKRANPLPKSIPKIRAEPEPLACNVAPAKCTTAP